jgi:NTP pyrophosphatase (non-canonical NTP hydrolase)
MVFASKKIYKNKEGDIHVGINAPQGFLECKIEDVKKVLGKLEGRKLFRCHVCNDLRIAKNPLQVCPTCFQIDVYVEINEKEMRGLLKNIDIIDQYLLEHYGTGNDPEKRILSSAVKLTEELGELCNEVLGHSSLQRKDKLDGLDKENLSEEVADVIITTLLLAKVMNVDVEKALEKKIEEINKRYS